MFSNFSSYPTSATSGEDAASESGELELNDQAPTDQGTTGSEKPSRKKRDASRREKPANMTDEEWEAKKAEIKAKIKEKMTNLTDEEKATRKEKLKE